MNSRTYLATNISFFMTNYGRELRMGTDIRIKRKVKKVTEFAERMKRILKKAGVVLKKVQEEMKKQADRGSKEIEVWKKKNKVMLSTKNLVFKE